MSPIHHPSPTSSTRERRASTSAMEDLINDVQAALAPGLAQVEWAESEIERACREHPAHGDDLFHAFEFLQPTADEMRTEFVFRSHCRELLERIATGGDTRPPTNAEVAAACCRASLVAPLTIAGFTVYMRAWVQAFPDKLDVFGDAVDPYEYVAGSHADTVESDLRRKLTVKDRTLRDVSCCGRHHGEPAATCRYYMPEQLGLPLLGAVREDRR